MGIGPLDPWKSLPPLHYQLHVAVEDRFVVFRAHEEGALLPEGSRLDNLVAAMHGVLSDYTVMLDARGLPDLYEDVRSFVAGISGDRVVVLRSTKDLAEESWWSVDAHIDTLTVRPGPIPLRYSALDLSFFEEDKEESLDAGEYLRNLVTGIARNSLLTEFCVQCKGESIITTPYHAHATHSIDAGGTLLVGRPAVIAKRTGALLREELGLLDNLLAGRTVPERRIDEFFQRHPEVFNAMGYAHAYSQVVLERDDGTSLRPDYILEPVAGAWCDILDIKRPTVSLVVGGRDRKTLAAAIHELAAQLREYAAYFEDPRLAQRVEQLYGIRCYKPRLVGVIGWDPKLQDERQQRRLMTCYADIEIVTFDRLLEIARSRILI